MTRRLRGVLRGLRDAWAIVGVTLILLVALEWTYRIQRDLRHGSGSAAELPAGHPYRNESWYPEWERTRARVTGERFDPYRAWTSKPSATAGLSVDSAGRRATVQPQLRHAGPRTRIFMLGGSSMWGYTARDAFTIPSLVAQRLADRGAHDVEVVNLAEPGYNTMQELATLLLEIRRDSVPDIAVFLHGMNELGPTHQFGRAGMVYSQDWLEFSRERKVWAALAPRSHLALRLGALPAPAKHDSDLQSTCHDVARYFRNMLYSIEALGDRFGFVPIFFWQPLLANSSKPLTSWERTLSTGDDWTALVQTCTPIVDTVMAAAGVRHYQALHSLFDADSSVVFIDDVGHLTERANGVIAERIVNSIFPLLPGRREAKQAT